jgi:hypothetical protein
VSCLPVLVLGMGAALAHLLRADAYSTDWATHAGFPPSGEMHRSISRGDNSAATIQPDRLAKAAAAAAQLSETGRRVSRRTLRTAGIHGSNTDLGALARILRPQPASGSAPGDYPLPAADAVSHMPGTPTHPDHLSQPPATTTANRAGRPEQDPEVLSAAIATANGGHRAQNPARYIE